jgi:hypothetical protein
VRPDHNSAGFGNGGQTAGHTQGDLQDRLSPNHASPGLYECSVLLFHPPEAVLQENPQGN